MMTTKHALCAAVTAAVFALSGCQSAATRAPIPASYLDSTPLSLSMDVPWGHYQEIYLPMPEDKAFEFGFRVVSQHQGAKWKPSAFLAFMDEESGRAYYFNLSVDTDLQKVYARAREMDTKADSPELANRVVQRLFDLDHEVRVRGKLEGRNLTMSLDGVVADAVLLPFDPGDIGLGVSSGRFNIREIAPPPPPAPAPEEE